jgi:hypothetical protein
MLAQAANLVILWSVLFGAALMLSPPGPAHSHAVAQAAAIAAVGGGICLRLGLTRGQAWIVTALSRPGFALAMAGKGLLAASQTAARLLRTPLGPRSTVLLAPWRESEASRAEAAWALSLQPGRLPITLDARGVYVHCLGTDKAAERAIAAARPTPAQPAGRA